MHFLDPKADGELMAELREVSLLSPDILERIDARMGQPETGTLDDLLLAGADWICEPDWISWLIRRHGCHRFGPVSWAKETGFRARGEVAALSNLPYRVSADGGLLIATLRPDRRAEAAASFPAPRLLWAAATLRETRTLRSEWQSRRSAPA
jgi:hypothetical protein